MSEACAHRPAGMRSRISWLRAASWRRSKVLAVATYPGATALTLAPLGAHSLARALVRPATADLEAVYPGTLTPPWKLSREAVLTILPWPRCTIERPTSRDKMKVERRLTSTT